MKTTEAFGPISSCLSHMLTFPGSEMSPGDTLAVLKYWTDGDIPFIAIARTADSALQHEYSIRMVLEKSFKLFMVLQVPPEWWDADEDQPPQTVVQVPAVGIIQCLDEFEVASLIPELKASWLGLEDLPGFEQKQQLLSKTESIFGALTEPAST